MALPKTNVYSITHHENIRGHLVSCVRIDDEVWTLWSELARALRIPASWCSQRHTMRLLLDFHGRRSVRVFANETLVQKVKNRAQQRDSEDAWIEKKTLEVIPARKRRFLVPTTPPLELLDPIEDPDADAVGVVKKRRVPLEFVSTIAKRVKLTSSHDEPALQGLIPADEADDA